MESSVQVVEISILRYIPELVAWLFGITLAVLMVRQGWSKAEKLFLAGCSLMFITRLATPLLSELVQRLAFERGMSNIDIVHTMSLVVSLPLTILAIAGLVCLVWAFWMRFRVRRKVSA